MTHIVIDSDVLDALIAAGDAVNHAADNRLCSCEWNQPYDGNKGPRVLVTKCFRCRALEQWASAKKAYSEAAKAAA